MTSGPLDKEPAPAFFSTDVSAARRFYLDLKPSAFPGLRVACGGFERCVPGYEIERSGFPYLSIEFVVHGKGALVLDGAERPLSAGAVFTYGPGVAHRIRSDAGDPMMKYFVDFSGEAARELLNETGLDPGTCTHVSAAAQIQNIFEDIIRNGLAPTPLTPRACALLVEYLILKIAEKSAPQGAANSRACATYERCRRFIEERFLEVRTLEEVADRCNVDKAYICRLFQKFDYQSPYQKLLRLQMTYASDRLQNSGRLVKEIADELGWDPLHFSRVFKKICGISPENFVKLTERGGGEKAAM